MTASPDWATWSLESARPILEVESGHASAETPKASTSSDQTSQGIALFTSTSHDDIYDTTWHDFDNKENKIDEVMVEGTANDDTIVLEKVDVEELFKAEESSRGNIADEELFEAGLFKFDPLSPVESRALQRALKLSKYIPPTVQEKDEEKRRMQTLAVINGRRRGSRMNEETGKRVYNLSSRGTGMLLKENNEARDVFQAMCKNMLPRRHFDWILAQLIYHNCNMIGFEDVPSSRSLARDEAKTSVSNQSMPMHHLAHVTRLLAEASKVDTTTFDIIDPTRAARAKGRPATAVKNKMMMQSKAVFDALKEIFPSLFLQQNDTESTAKTEPLD